jgi:hypothetical protein
MRSSSSSKQAQVHVEQHKHTLDVTCSCHPKSPNINTPHFKKLRHFSPPPPPPPTPATLLFSFEQSHHTLKILRAFSAHAAVSSIRSDAAANCRVPPQIVLSPRALSCPFGTRVSGSFVFVLILGGGGKRQGSVLYELYSRGLGFDILADAPPYSQAALCEAAFDVLRARFGAQFECFASPLNCRSRRLSASI